MRKLFLVLALLTATTALADITPVGKQNLPSINLLSNPGFENGKARYTASGSATYALVTGASALNGSASAVFTPANAGETLTSNQYPIPPELQGKSCAAKISYKTSEATNLYRLNVIDGSSVNQVTDPSDNLAGLKLQGTNGLVVDALATFRCPNSGTIALQLKAAAVVPTNSITIDDGSLGSIPGLGSISQAQLLGGAIITGCSGFSQGATTATAFPAATGCVYTTFGQALAPSTMIPGLKFAALPPGDIRVEYEGSIDEGGGGFRASFQLNDGTNNAREISTIGAFGGTTPVAATGFTGSFSYSTAQSNITFQPKAYVSSAGGNAQISASVSNPLVIRVYYYPSQAQTAVRMDATPASWTGYHNTSCAFAHVGAAATDPAASGVSGCHLVEATNGNRNFGAVTSFGGDGTLAQPGIVFNPPRVGKYSGTVTVEMKDTGAGDNVIAQVTDVTGNVLGSIEFGNQVANVAFTQTIPFQFYASSTSAYTLKVQTGASSATTQTITSGTSGIPLRWTVTELDATSALNALIPNAPIHSSAGIEKIERVSVAANCTSTPCTIASQSGAWVSSIVRNATGNYTVNFAASEFSAAPTCTMSWREAASSIGYADSSALPTSSAWTVRTYSTAGAAMDTGFQIICMGPH